MCISCTDFIDKKKYSRVCLIDTEPYVFIDWEAQLE